MHTDKQLEENLVKQQLCSQDVQPGYKVGHGSQGRLPGGGGKAVDGKHSQRYLVVAQDLGIRAGDSALRWAKSWDRMLPTSGLIQVIQSHGLKKPAVKGPGGEGFRLTKKHWPWNIPERDRE